MSKRKRLPAPGEYENPSGYFNTGDSASPNEAGDCEAPRACFLWRKCDYGAPLLLIRLDTPNDEERSALDEVQRILEVELGVSAFFDEDAHGRIRGLEFHWCLGGEHYVWDDDANAYLPFKPVSPGIDKPRTPPEQLADSKSTNARLVRTKTGFAEKIKNGHDTWGRA